MDHSNEHHQRAMDALTMHSHDSHHDSIDGSMQSVWSPDHEEIDLDPPKIEVSQQQDEPYAFASLGSRLSKRFTFIAQAPEFWNKNKEKFKRAREQVGWWKSCQNLVFSSWLNIFLVFLPIAWITNAFTDYERDHRISHIVPFTFCFLTLIPLAKILEFGGENLAIYCGKDLGDLIEVTTSNSVEALLALILLIECELKILQSSIIGVVLLRLLLVPGLSFINGGAHVATQELHPHLANLNQSLLTTGVLTLVLPIAWFTALNRGDVAIGDDGHSVVSDEARGDILKFSRGIAFILLAVYICSRIFIHRPPPGEQASLAEREDAPEEFKKAAAELAEEEPEMNIWMAVITMMVTLALLSTTAQFLVKNIEPMRDVIGDRDEWFGLILLPMVSFSPDGLLSFAAFIRTTFFNKEPELHHLADYRPIELSVQFLLFWIPLLILIGWFDHKPMSLLFDLFEVTVLVAACMLVNYVTADNKTNWAEGVMLVALYLMIATTSFFYPGEPEIVAIVQCDTVANFIAASASVIGVDTPTPTPTSINLQIPSSIPTSIPPIPAGPDSRFANATLSEKLQALLALYDVLISQNETNSSGGDGSNSDSSDSDSR